MGGKASRCEANCDGAICERELFFTPDVLLFFRFLVPTEISSELEIFEDLDKFILDPFTESLSELGSDDSGMVCGEFVFGDDSMLGDDWMTGDDSMLGDDWMTGDDSMVGDDSVVLIGDDSIVVFLVGGLLKVELSMSGEDSESVLVNFEARQRGGIIELSSLDTS